jgi:hypothetical protein
MVDVEMRNVQLRSSRFPRDRKLLQGWTVKFHCYVLNAMTMQCNVVIRAEFKSMLDYTLLCQKERTQIRSAPIRATLMLSDR